MYWLLSKPRYKLYKQGCYRRRSVTTCLSAYALKQNTTIVLAAVIFWIWWRKVIPWAWAKQQRNRSVQQPAPYHIRLSWPGNFSFIPPVFLRRLLTSSGWLALSGTGNFPALNLQKVIVVVIASNFPEFYNSLTGNFHWVSDIPAYIIFP